MQLSISEAAKMAEEIHYELIAKEEAAREREAQGWNVGGLDMPPLEARPSLAERVAKLEEAVAKERIQTRERFAALEARVAALEAALAEKLTVKVYTETPDYLKPPFKVT